MDSNIIENVAPCGINEELMSIITRIKSMFSTPDSKKGYPIIKQVADLAFHVPYHYDTVYEVYLHWDKDIEATKSAFIIASAMVISPYDVTKESMNRLSDVLNNCGITIG